jgi:site-specific DNA recombinase
VPSTNGHGAKPERVALLLRVSSEEQREKETIELQEEFLEQYCGLYELEVAEIYRDDGVSGTIPLHERPEGRRLLEDAKEDKFGTVLLYKLDRLGRTLLVIVDAHDRLQEAGVALRSATEPIDTSTPSGRLIFQMLASFAEYERETIGERTRAGLHRAYRNGKHIGRIPYGYTLGPDGASLEVVEDEAAIVREIISNIAAGATLYSEVKRLTDLGIPSPGWRFKDKERRYGGAWAHSVVAAIVHQSAYSGVHVVRTSSGEVIERAVPALADPDLQKRAVEKLAENKRYASHRKRSRRYLLSGFIRCAACGSLCTGRTTTTRGKRYPYYSCPAPRRERHEERTHPTARVSAPWLESLVWQDIKRFLESPGEVLERVREQFERGEATDDLLERREDLAGRLATKGREKDRYVRLYAQGHISEAELETYVADLKNQTGNLRLLLEAVEGDLAAKREQTQLAASTEAWLVSLQERIAEVEEDSPEAFEKRRELVRLLVERITVDRGEDGQPRVEITYRFGPPASGDSEKSPTDEFQGEGDMFVGGVQVFPLKRPANSLKIWSTCTRMRQ